MATILNFVAMADLPNRLYELRRAKGWSQQELADRAGCSKMHVSGLERGKREFSLTMMRRVAAELGVSTADLLSPADNPQQLAGDEKRLVEIYRRAEPDKREDIQRVAEALAPFREFPREVA